MSLFKARFYYRFCTVAVFLIALTGCSLFYFYRTIHEIPGMQWQKSDIQSFEVSIDEPTNLDGIFILRHVEGFGLSDIPIQMTIQKGDVVIQNLSIAVPIKDKKGKYIGDGSGDLWDVNYPIFSDRIFDAGHYTISFEHMMNRTTIPLIMEVGLQLERSREKSSDDLAPDDNS